MPNSRSQQNLKRKLLELDIEIKKKSLVELCRQDVNAFIEHVFKIKQHSLHRRLQELANTHRYLCIDAPVEHGKELPVDTAIPTPTGWRLMGELKRGDTVYGRDGKQCAVTFVTPIKYGKRVYRLTFDDGSTIDAGADHQWLVIPPSNLWDGDRGKRTVVTTADMISEGITYQSSAKRADGTRYHEYRWRLPITDPVDYPPRFLPIDPYVLGVWLGDGDSNGPVITFSGVDREIYDRCRMIEGHYSGPKLDKRTANVYRARLGKRASKKHDPLHLGEKLLRVGVLNNKHIPADYLTASIEQRRELLAGLLDTDGSIYGRNPRVELSFCNERLANDALELVRSLGFKASMITGVSKIGGKVYGERFRICFVAYDPVFKLQRKLARQRLGNPSGRTSYRCIVRIEEVPSVPVRCISVDSDDRTYIAGRNYTVTHNTMQMSVARVLWLLGNNHNHSIAIVGNAVEHPMRCLGVIRQFIEDSDELHEVFPDLKLKQDTKNEITVERGTTVHRDASVIALGITGTILGRRWTGCILDDIQDFDNTWTHEQRIKLFKILESTVLNRVVQQGFVLDIGTPWHVEDARHRLRKLPGYKFFRFDATEGLWPELYTDPQTGITWGWPPERLEQKRGQMSVLEFDRQFRCVASSGSFAVFNPDSIEKCLQLGRGLRLRRQPPPGAPVTTGIDLAIKKSDSADRTVFTTGTVVDGMKEILDIRSGQWELTEIARQVIDVSRAYKNHYGFMVESNAAQAYLLQALMSPAIMRSLGATDADLERIRVYPHYTGVLKYDPLVGIRALAADFDHGRIRLPCSESGLPEPPVADLITGMLAWDPMAHTSDFLMSYYLWVQHVKRFFSEHQGTFADVGVW